MDTNARYQNIIVRFLEEYAQTRYANMPNVVNQVVADEQRGHFLLLSVGWEGNNFVHSIVFHFDIINGKIWIQANFTEIDVAEMLVEAGVPKEDIVLGLQPPYARQFSGYAAA